MNKYESIIVLWIDIEQSNIFRYAYMKMRSRVHVRAKSITNAHYSYALAKYAKHTYRMFSYIE